MCTVRRTERGLGILLGDDNLVHEIDPHGGAAGSGLREGDTVVGLDGEALRGRPLASLLRGEAAQKTSYELRVRRGASPAVTAAAAGTSAATALRRLRRRRGGPALRELLRVLAKL